MEPVNLIDICRQHAEARAERVLYRFTNGERTTDVLTFAALDAAARKLAAYLRSRCQRGDRVLLLLEHGSDFVRAFFACQYAGMVAVPMNMPFTERQLQTTQGIARNARASLMLTSEVGAKLLADLDFGFPLLNIADVLAHLTRDEPFVDVGVRADEPAFLQYTSGSTGAPKGVIVSHANILANMEMIKLGFSHDEDTVVMGWLPFTHDMGLVGIMLQPFYLGVQSILLPPMAFVRRPARWLQLISEYRVTTSGAPDFAYAMCVRRVTERDLEGVDLSSWTLAFSGAETVRSNSLVAFAEKFGPYGFSPRAFYPCYGLAEATLFVTGPQARSPLRAERVPASSLEAGTIAQASAGSNERVRELISCGRPWSGLRLAIADPETLQKKPAGEVGEILVGGPSVTGGYWENPEQTAHAFGRYTADGDGPFLRTGDLGFIADGELFVTGRIKDLMIISGKNHYPQDIELTSSESDPVFSGRPAAAFVLSDEDDEAVVLVQEVPKAFAIRFEKSPQEQLLRELKAKIRNAVTREHGVALKRIVLVPQGALPMTTSGKIRRSNSRQLLVNNQLKEVGAAAQTA